MKKTVFTPTSFNVLIAALATLLTASAFGQSTDSGYPALPSDPVVGQWYQVAPEGAVNSDGSPWNGLFRKGSENKVAICLYGGGVSFNAHMAARPMGSGEEWYYLPYAEGKCIEEAGLSHLENVGLPSAADTNPFRNWTMLVVPYATGDWHVGTNDFHYLDLDGKDAVLYHHGRTNLTLFLNEALPRVGKPDDLLIAGYSAGGFGTAMVANDLVSEYFSDVENITVFVEAAMLTWDGWHDVAVNVWKAPRSISDRLVSDNMTLDSLRALSKDHPQTRILFSCSVRDSAIAAFQGFFARGKLEATAEDGDVVQNNLKAAVPEMLKLPKTNVLIWEGFGPEGTNLSGHALMMLDTFSTADLNGTTMADWVKNAVDGHAENHGLELLDKQYGEKTE